MVTSFNHLKKFWVWVCGATSCCGLHFFLRRGCSPSDLNQTRQIIHASATESAAMTDKISTSVIPRCESAGIQS